MKHMRDERACFEIKLINKLFQNSINYWNSEFYFRQIIFKMSSIQFNSYLSRERHQ